MLHERLSRHEPFEKACHDDGDGRSRTRALPAALALNNAVLTTCIARVQPCATFCNRPPTEMGFRGRGKYPNRTSAQVVAAGVHAGADSRAGAGDALPKHFYIGQLLRDGQHRAFK